MVHKRHHRIESRPRFRKLHLFFSLVARVKNLHHFEREQRGHLLVGPDGAEELLLRHLPVLVGVHLREGRVGQAGLVLARLLVVVAQELEQVLDDLLQLPGGEEGGGFNRVVTRRKFTSQWCNFS